MGGMLADLGACVRLAPMIQIADPQDWAPADAAVRTLDAYQWMVFTSANGPKYLAKRMGDMGVVPEVISGETSILALGPATAAAVEKYLGRTPQKVAGKYVAEGVVDLFEGEDMTGERVFAGPRERRERRHPQGASENGGRRG